MPFHAYLSHAMTGMFSFIMPACPVSSSGLEAVPPGMFSLFRGKRGRGEGKVPHACAMLPSRWHAATCKCAERESRGVSVFMGGSKASKEEVCSSPAFLPSWGKAQNRVARFEMPVWGGQKHFLLKMQQNCSCEALTAFMEEECERWPCLSSPSSSLNYIEEGRGSPCSGGVCGGRWGRQCVCVCCKPGKVSSQAKQGSKASREEKRCHERGHAWNINRVSLFTPQGHAMPKLTLDPELTSLLQAAAAVLKCVPTIRSHPFFSIQSMSITITVQVGRKCWEAGLFCLEGEGRCRQCGGAPSPQQRTWEREDQRGD